MTAAPPSLSAAWDAFRRELDLWAESSRTAWFWWRDDDATDITPALERLLDLQRATGVPLTLAVVPQRATQALADRLNSLPAVTAAQHGWAHVNHAVPGEKKSEFPPSRPSNACLRDLNSGLAVMQRLFPEQTRRILVPPWNRFPTGMAEHLPGLGIHVLSGFQLRRQYWVAAGLTQLNTHIDPVDWQTINSTAGCTMALIAAHRCLQAMRDGAAPQQALGLLTHHLRHDPGGWDFIAEFLHCVLEHPAARWLDLESSLDIGHPDDSVTPAS